MTIEDILANEIQRQGFRATPDVFREMLTECIGRIDDSGAFVLIPYPNEEGARSLALGDFVKSHRQMNPDSFVSIDTAKPENHRYNGLTQSYLEENRRTKLSGKPESGRQYTGKTLEMMNEIIASRKAGAM